MQLDDIERFTRAGLLQSHYIYEYDTGILELGTIRYSRTKSGVSAQQHPPLHLAFHFRTLPLYLNNLISLIHVSTLTQLNQHRCDNVFCFLVSSFLIPKIFFHS
jgi:hypothetical protein